MPGTTMPECLTVNAGHLFIEDCDAVDLADEFGTPVFVVSETLLRQKLRAFHLTFAKHWPEGSVRIMPAIKACPVIAVRQVLTQEGAGCDVFGPGELEGALRGGVNPRDISVNGSIKDRSLIQKAVQLGARVVADSPQDIELCEQMASEAGKKVRVMLRIKPFMAELEELSDFLPDHQIREMTQSIKYGIPTSEVREILPLLMESSAIDLVGVHMHMGRHSKRLSVWRSLIEAYVDQIKEISTAMGGWVPREVDFGGGIASAADRETRVAVTNYPTPSLEEYAEAITGSFRDAMHSVGLATNGIVIEIEPGRALHNETGIHLTRVKNTKQEKVHIQRRWAEVDTSEVFLGIAGVPTETPPFDFVIANKADKPASTVSDIVGCTCNAEWLCTQVDVPELEAGDIVAFLNTGAYIEPMAANFNALPRPGVVLVSGDTAELVKRHETVDEVFSRDIVPARLRLNQ